MAEEAEDVATDTSVDVEEATDSNDNSEQEDTVEEAQEDVVTRKQYNIAWMEAKRAKAELKKLRETQAQPPLKNDPFFEERIELLAAGVPKEVIEKAKIIALGSKISLTKALEDEMVQTYQKKLQEDKRRGDAKLGASKGSGESKDETVFKQGMERDEHIEAFNKTMGITN